MKDFFTKASKSVHRGGGLSEAHSNVVNVLVEIERFFECIIFLFYVIDCVHNWSFCKSTALKKSRIKGHVYNYQYEIGEELVCFRERRNRFRDNAIAVQKALGDSECNENKKKKRKRLLWATYQNPLSSSGYQALMRCCHH